MGELSLQEWYNNIYLHSGKWLKKRAERMEMDHHSCAICGATTNLQVHHISYENLRTLNGENVLTDLITLCRSCHFKIHEIQDKDRAIRNEMTARFKDEVTAATLESYIRLEQDRRRRIAQYMLELPIRKNGGADNTAESLLNRTIGEYGEIVYKVSASPKNITVNLNPNIPRAVQLARIMRGKKKYGADAMNTVEEWDKKFDDAIKAVKHDDDG